MKTNLGKVAITPKGVWNATTAYAALDTVNFGGGSWLAKRGNIAVTPTEGDDWMQLSAKGADAEVTKDSIVGALGFTPEKDYGNYELIETITLTEDTMNIVRTQEPDGTPYNFVKMAFLYSNFMLGTNAGSVGVVLNYGMSDVQREINLGQQFVSTDARRGALFVSLENGIIRGISTSSMNYGSYHYADVTFPSVLAWNTLKSISSGSIKSVYLSQYNGYTIKSGSVISIYAVRN